ncbi:hypothetical protein BKA65DRAFT_485667 [Rhexocercosporidium sp. MPI-PUGE-AT-0058]|nr:hypothetical protein BKA65DRAFT_485667 [Rhexocercosporidium sp. MPI-PUGE-AT-0058]
MVNKTSVALNITQNSPEFKLEELENSLIIFKKKLFSKTLNSLKENPENIENYRIVIIKCLRPGCNKTWKNERVYEFTSNYIAYYKYSHKAFNIRRVLSNLDDDSDVTESLRGTTSTISDAFIRQRAAKRPKSLEELLIKTLILELQYYNIENEDEIEEDILNKTIREELNDPLFIDAINKGIAKLRKYYLKQDLRIKRDGLELIGLNRGQSTDILNRLREIYNIYKQDYLLSLPLLQQAENINLNRNDDDDLDIYIENNDNDEVDEFTLYFDERRVNRIV